MVCIKVHYNVHNRSSVVLVWLDMTVIILDVQTQCGPLGIWKQFFLVALYLLGMCAFLYFLCQTYEKWCIISSSTFFPQFLSYGYEPSNDNDQFLAFASATADLLPLTQLLAAADLKKKNSEKSDLWDFCENFQILFSRVALSKFALFFLTNAVPRIATCTSKSR